MGETVTSVDRRTTANAVFDDLHREITSLELLPGTKLSEAEVARRFGVSRQPVREAFSKLDNLDLLLVRPQKASVVRGFSIQRVAHARFLRLAVELEVVKRACAVWSASTAEILHRNIEQQRQSLSDRSEQFHALDFQFHKLICELSGCPLAVESIAECRQRIERLCTLSLARNSEPEIVLDDHEKLAEALKDKSEERALAITRLHLGRLDSIIEEVHQTHFEYFE
jgi:DNA-binding GntR family transcriptional regulator